MKPKTIIITILGVLVLGGLLALSYKKSEKNATASAAAVQGVGDSETESVLKASEMIYDFGNISMKNGNVTKEFTVTNPTNKDITVNTVATSCMCTNAYIVNADGSTKGPFGMNDHGGLVPPANEIIKAGESRIIRVVYDPNAHGPAGVGQIDRFIMLADSMGGMMNLEIKANVTP